MNHKIELESLELCSFQDLIQASSIKLENSYSPEYCVHLHHHHYHHSDEVDYVAILSSN